MNEFKPLHDVIGSGRMAFAEGPDGECVDVFDLVRWLLHSGACYEISVAIRIAIDKLRAAVSGGYAMYLQTAAEKPGSPGIFWARRLGDVEVVRQERSGGWVLGRAIPYLDIVGGDPVVRCSHGPGHHQPYRPALVGPSGAIEWLAELLSKCVRLDSFERGAAHKDAPHFGIKRADAVTLFGYPPAFDGAAQVAVNAVVTAVSPRKASGKRLGNRSIKVRLYEGGALSRTEIVVRNGQNRWQRKAAGRKG